MYYTYQLKGSDSPNVYFKFNNMLTTRNMFKTRQRLKNSTKQIRTKRKIMILIICMKNRYFILR